MSRRTPILLGILIIAVAAAAPLLAVQASPDPVWLEQPDGTRFEARQWGDEWLHGWEPLPGPQASAPEKPCPKPGQVRPDLDAHDLKRDKDFPMDAVLDSLGIEPGMTVAEIGAGWGYLSFKLARRVAPSGAVLTEDISQKWLEVLKARAAERGLTNIETILGKESDPLFPAGKLDLIFMTAVLQWIEDRPVFLRTACAGLKPGGRLVIIEPETEGDDAEIGVVGSGHYPTRAGYLELFRRAGLEVISAEKKPEWKWPVFVLKKKLP